jgi:hypothetical protein
MYLGHCEHPPFLLVTVLSSQLQGYDFGLAPAMALLHLWGISVAKVGIFICNFVLFHYAINTTSSRQ